MPYQPPLYMPPLTLNVEELSRTQVTVCLNQAPGVPFFHLEALTPSNSTNNSTNSSGNFSGSYNVPTSTTDRGPVPASAYSVNFKVEQSAQGLVLRIFSSLNASTEQSNVSYLPSGPVDLMGVDMSSLWEYGGTSSTNSPSPPSRPASYDSNYPPSHYGGGAACDPSEFDFTSWVSTQHYRPNCGPLPPPNEILLPPPPAGAPSPASSSSSYSTAPSSDARKPTNKRSRDNSVSSVDLEGAQNNRRFRCLKAECSRRFTSEHTLELHMAAHKPKPKPQFPCTLGCSERFSRQHDRLRHEVAQHGKICEWLCDECGRFFSSEKTLGIHRCPAAAGGTRWVK